MLEVAGLDPVQESAYRTLLRLPAATITELAASLDRSPAQTAAVLRDLEGCGMVSVVPGTPPRFRATPPDLALAPLVQHRERELRDIRTRISQLTEEYRSRTAVGGTDGCVEMVYGSKAIAMRFEQLQLRARKEVRGLVKPPVTAVAAGNNDLEYAMLAEGVRYRVIYDRELLMLPGDPYLVARGVELGEEARIAVDLPLKLAIADDRLALVPVAGAGAGAEPSAVLVRRSGLLDALVALFESLWAASSPVLVGRNGELDEDDPTADVPTSGDMRLLSLLLAGLTDQSIAAQLGLSTRTVQRRLHDLIKITGVRTRVQLIWQATKRGWI